MNGHRANSTMHDVPPAPPEGFIVSKTAAQTFEFQVIRYPRLAAMLNKLARALHVVRDRQSNEQERLYATVKAFLVGTALLRTCRRLLPYWAYRLPEITEVTDHLHRFGIDATHLEAYINPISDGLTYEQREVIEQLFRAVLDPQLSRIGRYREPSMEYVLFMRRVTNPNDRLVVVWDEEIRLLYNDLRNPERERKRLSVILSRTTPGAPAVIDELVESIVSQPKSQLIPDSLYQVKAYPHIGKRFSSTATLDLHPQRHGANGEQNSSAVAAINQERTHITHNLAAMLIREGRELGWDSITHAPAIEPMRTVLNVIFDGVTQVSPSALRVALHYAYKTTTGADHRGRYFYHREHRNTHDVWICSLGGDEDVPPMIEGCILDMLLKLQKLEQLYVSGTVRSVPELWCVATFHSQAAENNYSKAGRPLDLARHTYNARLMIERLHAFVATFFPDIAHRCRFIEFPPYTSTGSARALFAAVWKRIPEHELLGARFAAIRGGVYDAVSDRIAQLFAAPDGNVGTYPVRHVFSNGLAAHNNGEPIRILRWAPMNTEPLFWIVSRVAYMEMLRHPALVRAEVASAYTRRGTPEDRVALPKLLYEIAFQQSRLNTTNALHGQIGIAVPALYYRHADDPTPGELATGGMELLAQLAVRANRDRQWRLQKMCELYMRLEGLPGKKTYSTFLADWASRAYGGFVPLDIVKSQAERTQPYVIRDATARSMLNFWLE